MDYLSQRRLELVQDLKKTDGHDAVLVTNPANVTYLSGFTGDSSYLIAAPKVYTLVTDSRYEQQAKEECHGIDIVVRPHDQLITDAVAAVFAKSGYKSIGLEAGHATLMLQEQLTSASPKLVFQPLKNRIEKLRRIKDPSEVEAIRNSIRVAERAYNMFLPMLRETDSEKDLVARLEGFLRRAGALCASFPIIVAIGERGALPHAKPTDRQVSEGSKLLVDWGANTGYVSDLTRVFRSPFGTAPSRRNKQERVGLDFEKVHNLVCDAQDAAAAVVRHGVPAKEVDFAARAVLAKAKMAEYFTHSTGHGIGLQIHEAPSIKANSDDILEAGMVITLEPAVYVPGWGGVRIEDNFLVTKEGAVRLSTLPRDPGAIG